jgi:hypothetical protein
VYVVVDCCVSAPLAFGTTNGYSSLQTFVGAGHSSRQFPKQPLVANESFFPHQIARSSVICAHAQTYLFGTFKGGDVAMRAGLFCTVTGVLLLSVFLIQPIPSLAAAIYLTPSVQVVGAPIDPPTAEIKGAGPLNAGESRNVVVMVNNGADQTFTATWNDNTGTHTMSIIPGQPVNLPVIADGENSVTTVLIKDSQGNVLAGGNMDISVLNAAQKEKSEQQVKPPPQIPNLIKGKQAFLTLPLDLSNVLSFSDDTGLGPGNGVGTTPISSLAQLSATFSFSLITDGSGNGVGYGFTIDSLHQELNPFLPGILNADLLSNLDPSIVSSGLLAFDNIDNPTEAFLAGDVHVIVDLNGQKIPVASGFAATWNLNSADPNFGIISSIDTSPTINVVPEPRASLMTGPFILVTVLAALRFGSNRGKRSGIGFVKRTEKYRGARPGGPA